MIIQGFGIVVEVIKVHPSNTSSVRNCARYVFALGGRYFEVDSAYFLYVLPQFSFGNYSRKILGKEFSSFLLQSMLQASFC